MGGKSDDEVEETPEQREAARVAAQRWNFSQQHLAPLMDQYLEQTDAMATDSALGFQRGRSNEEAQIMQGQQREQVNQQLNQMGIDPSSGRAQATNSQLTALQGAASGESMGRVQGEQLNQHVMGLQNAVNIGEGKAGQAQMGMGQLAQQSANEQATNAQNAFNRRSANMQLVGNIGGAGVRYGLENNSFGLGD